MKSLNQYVNEYLIKKSVSKVRGYKHTPKTKKELQEAILEELTNNNTDLSCIDTSKIKDMSYLFNDEHTNLPDIDISEWNVSNVETMEGMFVMYKNFNCDLSKWDVSNVYNMASTFDGCEKFEGKGLENWDIRNVEYMYRTFAYCYHFDGKSIEDWDVKNVVDMREMFEGCKNLNCDLSKWNVYSVNINNMVDMFYGCNKQKLPNWYID